MPYHEPEKPTSLLADIFFFIFLLFATFTFATIIGAIIFGAVPMVEWIAEEIYQIKN
jgi:hypothetical protein